MSVTQLQGRQAARLLRVSTTGQDEDNQDRPTAGFIEAAGMTLAKTYKLRGVSASKGKQVAAVRQAIADAQEGVFDVLVIRAIDRLDRRGVMAGWRLIGELMDAGIHVVSVADPELAHIGDDDYPMAGTMVSMKLDMARQEVKGKVRRINDTFQRMDDAGFFRGCAPAGYSVQGPEYQRYLTPDTGQEEVKVTKRGRVLLKRHRVLASDVETAFADATTGAGTTALGKRLGMTTTAVGKMIRSQVYSTGMYTWVTHRDCKDGNGKPLDCATGGERDRASRCLTVIHRCPPLVDPDVQAQAIAALEGRRTGYETQQASRAIAKSDLSGAIHCPCGAADTRMYRYTSGTGVRRKDGSLSPKATRYRCRTCRKSVLAPAADAAVEALMSGRASWWLDRIRIPGSSNAAALDRVARELRELPARGLDRRAEQAERDRLWAEEDRLRELPEVAPRWEQGFVKGPDGRNLTEGDRWRSLDSAGRRQWLTGEDIRVYATAAPGRTGAVSVELVHLDAGTRDDLRPWDDERDGEFGAA